MIEQAMKFLTDRAEQALKPSLLHIPGDPEDVSLLLKHDGSSERVTAVPGRRAVSLYRLDELVELANEHFDATIKTNGRMAIFHDRRKVVLVFDTADGRESATVWLIESDECAFFAARIKEPLIGVADFRRFLRFVLPETQDSTDIELLEKQVGSLGVDNGAKLNQESRRDRESIGMAITTAIAEKKDMPNPNQAFSVRPFHNPDLAARFPVACLLDPEPTTAKWLLWPLRSSWWDFQGQVTQYIHRELTGNLAKGIPVYAGSFTVVDGVAGGARE